MLIIIIIVFRQGGVAMARPDRSIDPRILESAKREFLERGFEKASLKNICKKAEVPTGALYKRYSGKEELFHAVVADTVADLKHIMERNRPADLSALSDDDLIRAWEMDESYMLWWSRLLSARRAGFTLLKKCAEGTSNRNFQHDWVAEMTDAPHDYCEEAFRRNLTETVISKSELHILLSAFWTTIYEPFIHGYTMEQIEEHSRLVCKLFSWHSVFTFRLPT